MNQATEKRVSLDAIRIDGDTQPREQLDLTVIADYAASMDGGTKFPPGEAVFDGEVYWLWDGFHRYHAERQRAKGKKAMLLMVRPGTVEDARWLALGANKAHGLRRTNADKRRAVEAALRMKPKESDRKLAEHIGVSHNFVSDCRHRLSLNDSDSAERIGRDGRTINTANIGNGFIPADPEGWADEQEWECMAGEPFDVDDGEAISTSGLFSLPTVESRENKDYTTLEEYRSWSEAERSRFWEIVRTVRSGSTTMNFQTTASIQWARWSWNPVTGCLHNCPYCYARDMAERFYAPKFSPALWAGRLDAPHNVKVPDGAEADIGLRNIFTCSMADLFGRWVPAEWVEAVLDTVRAAPQWNFLFLTKFPIRMAEFNFPDNAWVGTTVDCQARVANAEKAFRKVKAGIKWLSCEPLIEPLKFADLSAFQWIVLGGSSASTQTPEWHPPRAWVYDLERAARKAGCKVYEKENLFRLVTEYPGVESPPTPKQAPESLRYLPTDKG
jgi:protein gp37